MKKIILLISIIFLFGCESLELRNINYEPVDTENEYWKDGKLYQTQDINGVVVDVSLVRESYSILVFDIIVKNEKEKRINVIPQEFFIQYFENGNKKIIHSYDPELLISNKLREIQNLEVFSRPNIDNIEIETENEEILVEIKELKEQQLKFQEYELEKERLKDEYYYLKNNLIRKNSLRNEETLQGIVMFSKKTSDEFCILNIKIDNKLYQYKYKIRSDEKWNML